MERCYRVQWKKIFKYLRRAKYRQECNPNKYLNFFKLFKKKGEVWILCSPTVKLLFLYFML